MTGIVLQIYDGDDYEDEEPLRPMRDPIDDYYRDADEDEQPIATSTERQRQGLINDDSCELWSLVKQSKLDRE